MSENYKDNEAKLLSIVFGGTAQLKSQKAFDLCKSVARFNAETLIIINYVLKIMDAKFKSLRYKSNTYEFNKEEGSGSSRDWAAKGTFLLDVRAVLAECCERIHRNNFLGMECSNSSIMREKMP